LPSYGNVTSSTRPALGIAGQRTREQHGKRLEAIESGSGLPGSQVAGPSSTRGRLKALGGRPVTSTNVAPVPDPAAAHIATAAEPDATEVPDWDVTWELVDQWGAQSFPASDPPANW
jgi:hypothetical protein